jgi:ribosomal protein S18 acetylase RimI-like enzyme
MPIQIRTFIDKDLPTIVKMVNEIRLGSYEFTPYTEGRLQEWHRGGKLKILIAEEEGQVSGSAAYYDGYWGEEIEWLIVKERPDRRIIENSLLSDTEKYVQREGVFTVVDAGSSQIEEWTKRGYNAEGGLYHMVSELDSARPLPSVPEGIVIRSLRNEEEQRFVEAINKSFGTERVRMGDIEKWKSESPPFTEEWIHVAEVDERIVSVVVAKPDARYNTSFDAHRGYLGPAATLPEHRGKILALTFTRRAMNSLFEKGMDSAALYTSEQNTPSVFLLQKLGFNIGHHWKFMRRKLMQPQ